MRGPYNPSGLVPLPSPITATVEDVGPSSGLPLPLGRGPGDVLLDSLSDPVEVRFPPPTGPIIQENEGLRRSGRQKKISPRLKYCVRNKVWYSKKSNPPSAPLNSTAANESLYPFTNYVTCNKFFDSHKQFLASVIGDSELTQYSDFVTNPKRRDAMKQEIDALEKNGTQGLT